MAPLQRATLDNVEALGAAAALTGPAVRGDVGSIVANLAAIAATAPDAVAVYVVLCRAMVDLATRSGRLGAARGRRRGGGAGAVDVIRDAAAVPRADRRVAIGRGPASGSSPRWARFTPGTPR